jgi:hypothetical protein
VPGGIQPVIGLLILYRIAPEDKISAAMAV